MHKIVVLFVILACSMANPVAKDHGVDFDLNEDEIRIFEVELKGIADQLFQKFRVSFNKTKYSKKLFKQIR